MAEPTNPQDPNVRRDQPAAPQEPEGQEPEEHSPEAIREAVEAVVSNPATVQAVLEFFQAEGLSFDDVEIGEGMWGWREGADVVKIDVGSQEYFVSPDSETTSRLAIAIVTQDLEQEPEIFNQDWLSSYIDTDRLKRDLWSDVYNSVEESPDSYGWRPEETEDEEGNVVEEESPSEDWLEAKTEELLRDPMEYLRDIYGNETMENAMRIAGINVREAAEDAVAADGEGHFLGTYDGEVRDLPSGGQWWRHN